MANSLTHALPYPIRNARFALPVAFRVAAGTPTDPTTPDTEKSTDGGASFSDTTEEITTGGANGAGYVTLTGAETDNPILWIAGKSANCQTTLLSVHPRNLAIVGSGTLSAGAAGGGTLGTLLAYDVTGCFIRTTSGTGGGGTSGANNQARRIITYNTTTGAFTVSPNWETTPDNTTTYDVLLPEGVTIGMLQAINPATPGRKPVVDAAGLIDANAVKLGPSGTGTAQTARDIGASVIVGDKTGFSLSAGGIQAIWDALTSALTSVGSIGKLLVDKMGGVSGQLASQTEVTSIQNNTRCVRVVPEVIERPDAGTTTYRIELLLYDEVGNMEAPDSAPTLALVNQAGTDLSARLDSTTGSLVSTGRYRWIYTASSSHDLEQLVWAFSVVEGGATRVYGNTTLQVDTTSVDFTSSDRTKLDAIHGKLPSKNYLAGTSNSDGDVQIDESTGDFNATQQTRIQTQAAAAITAASLATAANQTTILARLGSFTGSGINTVLGAFRAIFNKGAGLTPTDLTTGVGASDQGNNTTDSLPALKEAIDEIEGGGGGGGGDVTGFTSGALLQLQGLKLRVHSPANGPNEPMVIVRGDDYLDTDGRAQTFALSGTIPDLDGATGILTIKLGATVVSFDEVALVELGDDDWEAKVEMSAAETELLAISTNWKYDLQITLSTGSKWTPYYKRSCHVVEDYTS